jgi:hypothetical protein
MERTKHINRQIILILMFMIFSFSLSLPFNAMAGDSHVSFVGLYKKAYEHIACKKEQY